MLESKFQSNLIQKIEDLFPGCVVAKFEPIYIQGFPDLLILYNDRWAFLECKRDKDAPLQPNQDYYVDLLNRMSYASFVYPENEREVLRGLQRTFKPRKSTRVS